MSFVKNYQIREGRWNDWCQGYHEIEDGKYEWKTGCNNNDLLYSDNGCTLIAAWEGESVFVFDEEFSKILEEDILAYEESTGEIISDMLSDKKFSSMNPAQLLVRLEDLLFLTNNNSKNHSLHILYYHLSELCKKEILSRMNN